ncbi:transposase [Pontibacter aydingkolensis]
MLHDCLSKQVRRKHGKEDSPSVGITMWEWVKNTFRHLDWKLEIVSKIHRKVFEALPKRWIVERTFGWLNLYRRLSKDYEYSTKSSETMIKVAMIHLMLKKLTK